jgi:indole-3-glycerol phosphate synthase
MATILDQIVETKISEVAAARRIVSESELRDQIDRLPPARDFAAALRSGPGRVRLIAEVKKASPSAGLIRADFDPVAIAQHYKWGGASCISVLTDKQYFQGDLEFLRAIRKEIDLPLLRKDFIIDPYQLLEARAAGADCVLLIAECLAPHELLDLHLQALDLGLQTLIELYDLENIAPVLATGGQIVGVNNRDLRTFVTDIHHTIRVRQLIPQDRILIGESGIATRSDVDQLAAVGVQAMLVGESLMRQQDVQHATEQLVYG